MENNHGIATKANSSSPSSKRKKKKKSHKLVFNICGSLMKSLMKLSTSDTDQPSCSGSTFHHQKLSSEISYFVCLSKIKEVSSHQRLPCKTPVYIISYFHRRFLGIQVWGASENHWYCFENDSWSSDHNSWSSDLVIYS